MGKNRLECPDSTTLQNSGFTGSAISALGCEQPRGSSVGKIALSIAAVLLFVAAAALLLFCWRRRRRHRSLATVTSHNSNGVSGVSSYVSGAVRNTDDDVLPSSYHGHGMLTASSLSPRGKASSWQMPDGGRSSRSKGSGSKRYVKEAVGTLDGPDDAPSAYHAASERAAVPQLPMSGVSNHAAGSDQWADSQGSSAHWRSAKPGVASVAQRGVSGRGWRPSVEMASPMSPLSPAPSGAPHGRGGGGDLNGKNGTHGDDAARNMRVTFNAAFAGEQ